ncbi:hypothetical protein Q5752_003425 [Cryptotrichosporon argae]
MAKGKSSNPADAFRKAQRAKELKKNKEARTKVRESKAIKSDTRELEAEIRGLAGRKLDDAGAARLAKLEAERDYVAKLKKKYVDEHPDARDRVYHTGAHRDRAGRTGQQDDDDEGDERDEGVWNRDGTLKDPKRSYYYDPVYNPFGVPPPGMPYRERSPLPGEELDAEVEAESDPDDDDSDDDIVMPAGPPPAAAADADADDSDDDIPLPAGPPPVRAASAQPPLPSQPPPHFRPPHAFPPFAPRPVGGPANGWAAPPGTGVRPPMHLGFGGPPPPAGPWGQPQPGPARPPRPPRGPHARGAVPAAVQDPLSDRPTQTFQGHRALPSRPDAAVAASASASASAPAPAPKPVDLEAATISAAPVLRDLRKEATAFVPRGVKRKPGPGAAAGVRVNAAPGEMDADGDRVRERAAESAGGGLLGKLEGVLGRGDAREKEDDDYATFLKGLGDI